MKIVIKKVPDLKNFFKNVMWAKNYITGLIIYSSTLKDAPNPIKTEANFHYRVPEHESKSYHVLTLFYKTMVPKQKKRLEGDIWMKG